MTTTVESYFDSAIALLEDEVSREDLDALRDVIDNIAIEILVNEKKVHEDSIPELRKILIKAMHLFQEDANLYNKLILVMLGIANQIILEERAKLEQLKQEKEISEEPKHKYLEGYEDHFLTPEQYFASKQRFGLKSWFAKIKDKFLHLI